MKALVGRVGRVARLALLALGSVLGIGLGLVVLRGTDWNSVAAIVVGFPIRYLAVALACWTASAYLRAVRWRVLFGGERVSTLRLLLVENAALGLNNISTVRALDELLIFGLLALRDRLPGPLLAATMVVCRVQDLIFTLLYLTLASFMLMVPAAVLPGLGLLGLYCVVWILILLNLPAIVRRFPWLGRFAVLSSLGGALRMLGGNKTRLLVSFGATCAYWLLLGPAVWALASGAAVEVSMGQSVFIVIAAILLSTSLPGLPGALGTFEFAVVSLLDLWGVPRSQATVVAVGLHAVLFVPPTLFALAVLPLEGLRSAGDVRDLLGGARRRQEEEEATKKG